MAVVRCPSLPAAINTEKGEDKGEGEKKGKKGNGGGRRFFEKERNEGGQNFGEEEKGRQTGRGRLELTRE
jgi:hypothetical protein